MMIDWLSEKILVYNYELASLILGWVLTIVIVLILEYKYLCLRKRKRD